MPGAPLDFFRDTGSVRWYRGMSSVQTGACDHLLHALRDDTEQGSTYRVRRCLSQLGLHPLVRSDEISTIMGISRCNDLAFLWFLWEAAYKQPRAKNKDCDAESYTVNEQLLLSGIAHLDMPSTLRALDTLLPPACQSQKSQKTIRQSCRDLKRRPILPKQRNDSPYFLTQVRPREFIPRGRFRPPETKLQFPEYSVYANRMHEIPNEQSRWFAEYKLCPEKRVIKNLLAEELNKVLLGPGGPPEEAGSLCETHRIVEGIASLQRQQKAFEVFRRCLSQLDVPGSELKARRKCILADLEREIECAADKIRGESRRFFSQVSVRNEGGSASCQLCHLMVSVPGKCTRTKTDRSMLMGLSNEEKPRVHQLPQETTDGEVKVMLLQRNERNRCGAGDCRSTKVEDEPKVVEVEEEVEIQPRKSKARKSTKPKQGKKPKKPKKEVLEEPPAVPVPPVQNLADLIPPCSRTLPCLITQKPLRYSEAKTFTNRNVEGIALDFHKVFDLPGIPEELMSCVDPDYFTVEDKQPVIKMLCIAALNAGQSQKVKEFRQDRLLSPVLRAAATCAVDMFRTKLAEGPEPVESQQAEVIEVIDPNNIQQIQNLLKGALQVLRSNPRFVLASFPNAHKMPVLLDWVADRYGKTFNQEEMNALVKSNVGIYDRIYRVNPDHQPEVLRLKRGLTSLSGAGTNGNHKGFLCLARQRKGKYHGKLNELALEQARLTWLALRGYSHLGGHIKDTFFAYMPARESDLKREHMWRSNDYRNMVENRRKSQRRSSA